jgi:hypothetical protein
MAFDGEPEDQDQAEAVEEERKECTSCCEFGTQDIELGSVSEVRLSGQSIVNSY